MQRGVVLQSYTLTDISGKQVAAAAMPQSDNTIHLDVPNGVYFLVITDTKGQQTRHKVVVMR